ncbi:GFA family protein [Xanthomonas maliensis]|uniref:GFA family protein n=1 Tax=Xanthomonas maliensis TaxID=1321368 RepID=UPI0003B63051|nr:GFA family protein [Xanthomonas maliensis]KAB7771248.1 aldehyde-activating protein [Xanthomonas maliensis]
MGSHSGGCQCGAVRFHVDGALEASICHCRMCQKAFGNYFAPLVSVRAARFAWTRGAPAHFASSNLVRRGFCAACGTPLTYEAPDGMAVAHGAFDTPAAIVPVQQYGLEGHLPFVSALETLPGTQTEQDASMAPYLADLRSAQHPDHDTAHWPPAAS